MGVFNIYPTGITSDGKNFYLVNSSDGADHLYTLDYAGKEVSRYDFPYQYPQSIVWTTYDIRDGGPPVIANITPSKGVKGTSLEVDISGSGFKSGLSAGFGDSVSVDTVIYINPNQLHLYITIAATAVPGLRSVTITNKNGTTTTAPNGFEITATQVDDYIYMGESNYSRIYKIRIKDSTVTAFWSTKSISSASSVQGLGFDGTDFWLSLSGTDRSLYKLILPESDTNATASQAFPIAYTGGTLRGITFYSGFLWQCISETVPTLGKIIRIDPATGTNLDTIITPGSNPRGITWVNGKVYCNDTDKDLVYEYNISTKAWISVCSTPTAVTTANFATGLTSDGTNFWIANSSGLNDHLFKISISGQILNMLNTRNVVPSITYDLAITGILFIAK